MVDGAALYTTFAIYIAVVGGAAIGATAAATSGAALLLFFVCQACFFIGVLE